MSFSRTLRYKPGPPIARQYVTILYNYTNPFSILHNSRFHLPQQGQISYFQPVTARIHTLCVCHLHSAWRQKSDTGIYYVGRCELKRKHRAAQQYYAVHRGREATLASIMSSGRGLYRKQQRIQRRLKSGSNIQLRAAEKAWKQTPKSGRKHEADTQEQGTIILEFTEQVS